MRLMRCPLCFHLNINQTKLIIFQIACRLFLLLNLLRRFRIANITNYLISRHTHAVLDETTNTLYILRGIFCVDLNMFGIFKTNRWYINALIPPQSYELLNISIWDDNITLRIEEQLGIFVCLIFQFTKWTCVNWRWLDEQTFEGHKSFLKESAYQLLQLRRISWRFTGDWPPQTT